MFPEPYMTSSSFLLPGLLIDCQYRLTDIRCAIEFSNYSHKILELVHACNGLPVGTCYKWCGCFDGPTEGGYAP